MTPTTNTGLILTLRAGNEVMVTVLVVTVLVVAVLVINVRLVTVKLNTVLTVSDKWVQVLPVQCKMERKCLHFGCHIKLDNTNCTSQYRYFILLYNFPW